MIESRSEEINEGRTAILAQHNSRLASVEQLRLELTHCDFGRFLQNTRFAEVSLWEILSFEVSEYLYEWSCASKKATDASFSDRIGNFVWQSQLNADVLNGLIRRNLPRMAGAWMSLSARAAPKPGRTSEIAFAGFYRHVPLLDALEKIRGLEPSAECSVLVHDDLWLRHSRSLKRARVPGYRAEAFLDAAARKRARDFSLALNRKWRGKYSELIAFIVWRLSSSVPQERLFCDIAASDEFLRRTLPYSIVIPDLRLPLARAISLFAEELRISVTSASSLTERICRHIPPPPTQSRVIAIGGGSPSIPKQLRAPGISTPRTKKILYASQGKSINRIVIPAVRAAAQIAGADLVIRPHPVEIKWILRLLARPTPVISVGTGTEAIVDCDLLICHSSSLAFEAARIGRPVIIYSPGCVPQLHSLLHSGCAEFASTPERLSALVKELLEH